MQSTKYTNLCKVLTTSPEITPITTRTVLFNIDMDALIIYNKEDPGTGYQYFMM